jgi:hypothetical protein
VENFLNKHAADVISVLSGFDRLVFRSTLRILAHHLGMMRYLRAEQVLLKDFAGAGLPRRAEVSDAANNRYLQALASVDDVTSLGELTAQLCRPTTRNGRRVRAPNPHAPAEAALIEAIGRSEFTINGFRNHGLQRLLFFTTPVSKSEQKRRTAAVRRRLALLRAHHLIRKVPHTHRYLLTDTGRITVTALITARRASTQELTKIAA